MLNECIEGLNLRSDGTYIDVTFGGGGHSKEILKHLDPLKGKLVAFDQDEDACANAKLINHGSFKLVHANFKFLKRFLKMEGITKVDGILADLGVSSHQIDTATRGFSTRFNGPLDMRMDQDASLKASDVLNSYTESELHRILGMYGEIKNAKTLASEIVKARINQKFENTEQLRKVALQIAPRKMENKYLAQIFQALRIEVNDELKALENLILQSSELLNKGGRLVIMSYHSLEDRLVKNFIAKGKFYGDVEKDLYGNYYKPLEAVHKKTIEATEEEISLNPRSRSAKLRIAEKMD
jgi:16S rRNA (cytosine1402-N4)-methyltransferase